MLELRPSCEHCDCTLQANNTAAMICSFECTFCATCVNDILQNVCPNCGGGFTRRPIRPKSLLEEFHSSKVRVHKPIDIEAHAEKLAKFQGIDATKR